MLNYLNRFHGGCNPLEEYRRSMNEYLMESIQQNRKIFYSDGLESLIQPISLALFHEKEKNKLNIYHDKGLPYIKHFFHEVSHERLP